MPLVIRKLFNKSRIYVALMVVSPLFLAGCNSCSNNAPVTLKSPAGVYSYMNKKPFAEVESEINEYMSKAPESERIVLSRVIKVIKKMSTKDSVFSSSDLTEVFESLQSMSNMTESWEEKYGLTLSMAQICVTTKTVLGDAQSCFRSLNEHLKNLSQTYPDEAQVYQLYGYVLSLQGYDIRSKTRFKRCLDLDGSNKICRDALNERR